MTRRVRLLWSGVAYLGAGLTVLSWVLLGWGVVYLPAFFLGAGVVCVGLGCVRQYEGWITRERKKL